MENLKVIDLPIEAMFPRIIDARSFELTSGELKRPIRTANLYELGFYTGGGGTIIIEKEKHPVHFGDVRFIKPGTKLSSKPNYKCYTVIFDFGNSNTVYKNQILDNMPAYFKTNGEVLTYFEKIIKSHHSSDGVEKLNANALLMGLIYELFSSLYSKKKYSESVRKCILYMEENFGEEISLVKLSKISGYSDIHTMRIFKKETGQTPHEWLTKIRLNKAKEYLTSEELTITEIAEECGFKSDSHFKILFKKITGLTPGAYRKNTSKIY